MIPLEEGDEVWIRYPKCTAKVVVKSKYAWSYWEALNNGRRIEGIDEFDSIANSREQQ